MNVMGQRVALIAILLATCSSALAYRYTALQNGTVTSGASAAQINTLAPRLHVDIDQNTGGNPVLISFDGIACGPGLTCDSNAIGVLQSAANAARNRWNAVRNTTGQGVLFAAPTNQISADPCGTDGVQVIAYSSSNCDGANWPANLLGIATTTFQGIGSIGAISELDIAINPNENWGSFDGAFNQNGQIDLNRVLLHEMGHTIGLDHPDEFGDTVAAIMNASAGNTFELQNDDINGDRDLANSIIANARARKGGLVNRVGFSASGNQLSYTVSACLFEDYFRNVASLPDGEIALILTQSNNVNEAGRHVTGQSGPQATDGSTLGFFDRNLGCPEKQFQGTFSQPPQSGNYFQHLGLFSLNGDLLDSVTFEGQQFFIDGGPTPTPGATSSPDPTTGPSATPTPAATPTPSGAPAVSQPPRPTPGPTPSTTPTPAPTGTPTAAPSASPEPSATPTASPTASPSPTQPPSATASPAPSNPADDGDSLATASQIDINGGQAINARIDGSEDIDVFAFTLTQRSEISIRSSGETDVEAVLVDENDQFISGNDDAAARAKNFALNEVLPPGRYFVKVFGVMGASGPYQLDVSSKAVNDGGGGGGSGALYWPALLMLWVWRGWPRRAPARRCLRGVVKRS